MEVSSIRAVLLGPLSLFRGEESLPLPASAAACSLLGYLLLHREHPHERPVLAGTLWPEKEERRARRTLSQALWLIRRTVPDIVQANHKIISIPRESSLLIDVEAFQSLVGDVLTNNTPDRGVESIENLRQAVNLYHGDLLEGFFHDWVMVKRERLREMHLSALEQLVQYEKAAGRFQEALDFALTLSELDQLRESAHREVMRLYFLLGRPQAALQRFEKFRQIIGAELFLEPEPETIELAHEITQRSSDELTTFLPETSRSFSPPALDEGLRKQLPLIGRGKERAEILAWVDRVFSDHGGFGDPGGGVVLVEGEAGIGKTRLLQEITRDAEWRGAQVLWGRGRELEAVPPFTPLMEALGRGLNTLRLEQLTQGVDKIWMQVLAPLLPELAVYHPELTPAEPLYPAQEQTRLVEALFHFLETWARITPLIFILEDLHWVDRDTLDLLILLTQRLKATGLILIITYRSEEARTYPDLWEKLQGIDRTGLLSRMTLERLDEDATGDLIRKSLGLGRPAPLFESRLYQETGGNPLFVLETLRTLIEEGNLSRDETGVWSTPWDQTSAGYAELPLPEVVERVIARRLERLTPIQRNVLNNAAVLGNLFTFSILMGTSELETDTLFSTVRELMQRHFLIETQREIRFVHEKIRLVAYQTIEAEERTRLHRQSGFAIEQHETNNVTSLAHHFLQGEVWEKAVTYCERAAERARSVYANTEAVTHLSHALDALERIPGQPDLTQTFELRMAREEIFGRQGERGKQAEELSALEKLAGDLDDENQMLGSCRRVEVALRRASCAEVTGDYASGVTSAQQVIDMSCVNKDLGDEAAGYQQWGRILWRQGNYKEAHTQLERALALAREAKERKLEADSLRFLGNIAYYLADIESAKVFQHDALHIYRLIGRRQGEGRVFSNLGVFSEDQGSYAKALLYYQQALDIWREIGFREGESIVFTNLGYVYQHLGDYKRAREHFEDARKICIQIGFRQGEGWGAGNLSILSHHLGDDEAARVYCLQALKIAQEIGDRENQGYALNYLGHASAGLGRLEEATTAYMEALDIRRELSQDNLSVETLAGLARVYMSQGDLDAAQKYVEEILEYLETDSLEGSEEPFRIYLTCYRILRQDQDPRAGEILDAAFDLLNEQAARIEDEEMRRSYLENVVAHGEIIAAHRQQYEHTINVSLPGAAAPLGRPLRDGEWVELTWTVAAVKDEDIEGKAPRRRHQLLRLLEQAQEKGAAPAYNHLADALGVSLRTIERDMAALRESGCKIPPTRRKMAG